MIARSFLFLAVSSFLFFQNVAFPQSGDGKKDKKNQDPVDQAYSRSSIAQARFGNEERRQCVEQARKIRTELSRAIIGQERALKILQDRMVQYCETFGTRKADPIALHFIGFPGIGKSEIFKILKKLGFQVLSLDAQKYASKDYQNDGGWDFKAAKEAAGGKPAVILIDELDKLPEIGEDPETQQKGEVTRPFIGSVNQILNDGQLISRGSGSQSFSNLFIATTMNFSPAEVEKHSKEVLGKKKSFYELTIADFAKFDAWLNNNPSARYKVLSQLFRSNTVSRLGPNTLILKPLTDNDYLTITRNIIQAAIERSTRGANRAKKVTVEFTDEFAQFLKDRSVFAPTGARETVFKADALTEQVIAAAIKIRENPKDTLDQPRRVYLDVSQDKSQLEIKVEILVRNGKKAEVRKTIKFSMAFDPNSRSLETPENVAIHAPKSIDRGKGVITQKVIANARFPELEPEVLRIADEINYRLVGQDSAAEMMQEEIQNYMSRVETPSEPIYKVIAGFPGIGKSEIMLTIADTLGLPVVRINLQQHSSDDPSAVENFIKELNEKISTVEGERPDGRYLLLFEEMDKTFEVNPMSGELVNRPVMAAIKDLLSSGRLQGMVGGNYGDSQMIDLDIRKAYTGVTMNFATSLFKFKADPRQTTIDDVMAAYRKLAGSPADLRSILEKMFLPETINRILPKFVIMKPLSEIEFNQLIDSLEQRVENSRFVNAESGVNEAQITLKFSKAYKKYLFNETVIPSEGARYTVIATMALVTEDIQKALNKFKKSASYAKKPLTLTLDYSTKKFEVSASVSTEKEPKPLEITRYPVNLIFPPTEVKGALPEDRLKVAIHEFGHAMAGVRLGLRFEYATTVSPSSGIGGYVKFKESLEQEQLSIMSFIYAGVASRAMERIYASDDPMNPKSVMEISAGSYGDIEGVTTGLWSLAFKMGFNPSGGTGGTVMEEPGMGGMVNHADIDTASVRKIGLVLRDMENHLVQDLLKAHPRDWYNEKIVLFGRKGGMTEKEFYDLIGFPYPGDNEVFIGGISKVFEEFSRKDLKKLPKEAVEASKYKQGLTQTTAAENVENYRLKLEGFFKAHWDERRTNRSINTERCADKVKRQPAKKKKP